MASAALFGASTPLARALVGTPRSDVARGAAVRGIGPGAGGGAAGAPGASEGAAACALHPRRDAALLAGDRWRSRRCGGPVAAHFRPCPHPAARRPSLLLNLETVLTVGIAWFVFGEHRDARVVAGMALIVPVGLRAREGGEGGGDRHLNAGRAADRARLCRLGGRQQPPPAMISGNDAVVIAAAKGRGGRGRQHRYRPRTSAPRRRHSRRPRSRRPLVGLLGYGASLVLFVAALRHLGVARASAYFAIAPFIGVAVAFGLLGERPGGVCFGWRCRLMAAGVWLHLTERHGHAHAHERLAHTHPHRHDEHHRHEHDFAWDGQRAACAPRHEHAAIEHSACALSRSPPPP